MEEEKYIGKVIWFNPKLGFGFISREGETDLFVYWSDIVCEGFKTLKKDQEVAFSIGLNNYKQLKAVDVVIISEGIGGI
jgi:CspA family cold shock protein